MTWNFRAFSMHPALLLLAFCLAVLCRPGVGESGAPGPGWMAQSRQLVLVTSADWAATSGTVERFERGGDGAWRPVGPPEPVDLGRSGLGWGIGLHAAGDALADEPAKAEGDGRAPCGAFELPCAFAYHPEETDPTAMPVVAVGPDLYCVDDPNAAEYNSLVRLEGAAAPWKSAETMLRPDGVYRLGLLVAHNRHPATPGSGSCIFMHFFKPNNAPTSGCTAMDPAFLRTLILWLDPAARPVLVQLPRAVRDRLSAPWGLP